MSRGRRRTLALQCGEQVRAACLAQRHRSGHSATPRTAANVKSATVPSTAMSPTRGTSSGARVTIARHPVCHGQAEHAAGAGHENDLAHPQPRDGGARCAEREADAVFVPRP